MSLAVANRYARALADVVLAPGSGVDAETALGQVRAFGALVKESLELTNVLVSPAVSLQQKQNVAQNLGGRLGLSRVVQNFVLVVIKHRRAALLPQMAQALETVLDERLGRVRAAVTSASPLDEIRQNQLREELSRMTGKQVRCEFDVDAALMGGVSVRVGSTVYDGSVSGRLEALRQRMLAE